MIRAFSLVLQRELRLAVRRWSDLLMPLVFFVIVCTLFPLAVGQDPEVLRSIGPGAVWVAALLATLLSLNGLFREDFADGSLEQLAQRAGHDKSWASRQHARAIRALGNVLRGGELDPSRE